MITLGIITTVFIGFLACGYLMLFRGAWPDRTDFSIDFDQIRQLAAADDAEYPLRLNRLVIATGELPGWGVVAGDLKGGPHGIEFPSFQLVYADKTAIIEVPFNQRLFEKFPFGKNFFGKNYDKMQEALLAADIIVPTHEHWDHLGGIAQSENIRKLLPKTVLTTRQINGPTIKDAEFPENAFDGYQPVRNERYQRIAPGLVVIAAPGHSVGHQFVFCRLRDGTEFLFTGDVVWVTENLRKRLSRPWLASKKRLENRRQIAHQMKWLFDEFYSNENQTIHMVTTHDPKQHRQYMEKGLIHGGFEQR